jgi:4-amino-4-deoxy-L-arabinose transferase-like glycosyltransferase
MSIAATSGTTQGAASVAISGTNFTGATSVESGPDVNGVIMNIYSHLRRPSQFPTALPKTSSFGRWLFAIAAIAFFLRIAVRATMGAEDFWQNGYTFYFDLARSLADGNGFAFPGGGPTAFRVPLYPMFLAVVTLGNKSFTAVLVAQSAVGAATAFCAGLLGREMFGDRVGLAAAALTSVYPYYVVHDTALQETSLFTLLTLLSVFLLLRTSRTGSRSLAVGAGLGFGAATLARVTVAPVALLAPLWLLLPTEERFSWRDRAMVACLCLTAVLITLSPWLIRSHRITGAWTLGTEFGAALWRGNNAKTFRYYPRESIDLSFGPAFDALGADEKAELTALSHDEIAASDWYQQKGVAYIKAHPEEFVLNGFEKIMAAFGWLPSPRGNMWRNMAYLVSYAPIMAVGLWGMWLDRRRWRINMPIYWLFLSFAVITAVLWGHTSHRAYLDVYWIIYASVILIGLMAWAVRPKRSGPPPG